MGLKVKYFIVIKKVDFKIKNKVCNIRILLILMIME